MLNTYTVLFLLYLYLNQTVKCIEHNIRHKLLFNAKTINEYIDVTPMGVQIQYNCRVYFRGCEICRFLGRPVVCLQIQQRTFDFLRLIEDRRKRQRLVRQIQDSRYPQT